MAFGFSKDWHPAQVNMYTTMDFRATGKQSLKKIGPAI